MKQILLIGAALVTGLLVPSADAQGPDVAWLEQVKVGVERYMAANGDKMPHWSDIFAHNKGGIQRATRRFVQECEYNPLEVYGFVPNGLPLPDRPSTQMILVKLSENVKIWVNADGQLENTPLRYVLFKDEAKKIRAEAINDSALSPIQTAIDSLKAVGTAEPDFPAPQSHEIETVHARHSGGASVTSKDHHDGKLSYLTVGVISVLSAAAGALIAYNFFKREVS